MIIVPRSDDYVKDLAKASWLIGRLGNSESYVSVSSVEVFETRDCDVDEVNVVVKFNPSYIVGGSYIVNKAVDEDGNEELLAFPVSSYQRGDVYYPSRVKVKDRVYCVDDKVFIPKGDWW
jgi:CRISPR/Cas system-associated protein Cas5 (RAMP superfamily)